MNSQTTFLSRNAAASFLPWVFTLALVTRAQGSHSPSSSLTSHEPLFSDATFTNELLAICYSSQVTLSF